MHTGEHPIRAVTFDLWETLLFESDGASQRRADVRSKNLASTMNNLGMQVSAEKVSEGISKTVSSLLARALSGTRTGTSVASIRLDLSSRTCPKALLV